MRKIRVGIIGAGSLSEYHVEAYRRNPAVEIAAVCDSNMERALNKAKEWDVQAVYSDYNEMFALSSLDAVSIITCNNTHAPIAISALNAGINVLCEKPPAINAAEALQMKEAADRNNRLLMFGFVRRFAQNTQFVKEIIENGLLGNIYYAKTGILRRCGNPGGWFANKAISGGGPLIDLGVHIIDLAIYLMGRPKAVAVFGNTSIYPGDRKNIKGISRYVPADAETQESNVENFANAIIRFDNGSCLYVETSWTMNIKSDTFYMDLFGDRGGACIGPKTEIYSEQNNYLVDIKPVLEDYFFNMNNSFMAEINHFVDCVTRGAPCLCPAEDGVQIMKIIDAVYTSAKTGELVKL